MRITNWIRNVFGFSTHRESRNHQKKKSKLSIANALILKEGRYCAENFDNCNDFEVRLKIKSGSIKRTLLKKMRKGEDTYMFNIYKITPKTTKALVLVIKENIVPSVMGRWKKPTRVWRILLIKNKRKRERILRIEERFA